MILASDFFDSRSSTYDLVKLAEPQVGKGAVVARRYRGPSQIKMCHV